MNDELKITPEMLDLLRQTSKNTNLSTTRLEPCLCGKLLDTSQWIRKFHSGRFYEGKQISPGINYTDLVCEDCRKTYAELPRIVCIGCRSLMGFYRPGKQATGFEFEKNRHYHILDCLKCNPTRNSTPVLEHEQFCRANRIKTVIAEDLIQEIEQKILQSKKEAAILRSEFEASKLR